MKMTSNQIRACFLDYFATKQHQKIVSSSLIPTHDPSLLFTNAGMVPFKDVFLGLEQRPYTRATSSQRCLRVGGKHNDLDNVGYTARHHTFFEMLGNFSFGDYFKSQAIQYAWDFLINYLQLPKDKLWITVFQEDHESREIWIQQIGLSPERVIACGEKDNFWRMGDTGPCGPCTEIYYDHGESIPGGLPNSPNAEGDRYVEIWNLVFMQYNCQPDGSLLPLPKPSVDTGMGLERITAILQGVHSNYDTDIFTLLIQAAQKLIVTPTVQQSAETALRQTQSLHVLADHIRSSCFLILDGVIPANEGRGYVLRRIIRRALRHGYQCGIQAMPFFYQLVSPLIQTMGEAYPLLISHQAKIEALLIQEEKQFSTTLTQGLKILHAEIAEIKKLEHKDLVISGELAFKLYDTYGFPVDLTADIARENNLPIDIHAFNTAMAKQKTRARSASAFQTKAVLGFDLSLLTQKTDFIGYDTQNIASSSAKIIEIITNPNAELCVILDRTPFYAESGGQIGDTGKLISIHQDFSLTVHQTIKQGPIYLHQCYLQPGNLRPPQKGDAVLAQVDTERRKRITLNHTATHLLHAALRKQLGDQVVQKGSLVADDRLRLDFAWHSPVDTDTIQAVERLVNQAIQENYLAEKNETTPEKAIQHGALALFGEKYGDTVRTLKLGNFSYELCGGTHVDRTGDIGFFKIISQTGIAAGVRRIEALTGLQAINWILDQEKLLFVISQQLHTDKQHIPDKLQQILIQQKADQQNIDKLCQQLNQQHIINIFDHHKNKKIITAHIPNLRLKDLRDILEGLKQKIKTGIIALTTVQNARVHLIIGVTKDLTGQYPADQLIAKTAKIIDGKGGGRPELAQATGHNTDNIRTLLTTIEALL